MTTTRTDCIALYVCRLIGGGEKQNRKDLLEKHLFLFYYFYQSTFSRFSTKNNTMRIYAASFLAVTALPSAASSSITLVTFDGTPSTTHRFSETNDPVMGGRSTGTFSVENRLGVFDGQVVDVPSLSAPGFIKADADMGEFPDISSCSSIVIEANTSAPYDGYRCVFSDTFFRQ